MLRAASTKTAGGKGGRCRSVCLSCTVRRPSKQKPQPRNQVKIASSLAQDPQRRLPPALSVMHQAASRSLQLPTFTTTPNKNFPKHAAAPVRFLGVMELEDCVSFNGACTLVELDILVPLKIYVLCRWQTLCRLIL